VEIITLLMVFGISLCLVNYLEHQLTLLFEKWMEYEPVTLI
jgi:hypothetical protein